jgi:hypothetical protein
LFDGLKIIEFIKRTEKGRKESGKTLNDDEELNKSDYYNVHIKLNYYGFY